MNIELQSNYKTPLTGPVLLTKLQDFEQEEKRQKSRKEQPLILYILVSLMELITIFLSILLLLVDTEHKKWVYLTYICMTVVRVIIFSVNTIYLIGIRKKTLALYFLLDNTFLVMVASDITYVFLNYQSHVQYAIGAIVCYPILLFFLVGNFRVMLLYSKWSRCQVILYKLIKIIGSTYFLVYGCYLIIWGNTQNKEILLLWILTTCTFWAQMAFLINVKDRSDKLATQYILTDED